MYVIKNGINMAWNVLQSITFMDIIDMLLMSYLIYILIKFIRETRAGQLIKGILLIAAAYLISTFIGLKSISYIIKSILDIGLLAILIMFQPEIRRALEKAGRTKLGVNLLNFSGTSDEITSQWNHAIEAICDSCMDLSSTRTGALIVIERQTKLGEQIANGTIINAKPSKELFGNIFYPNTPLHDGAVVIRDGIILAAACFLPKPQKEELINKKLGSRHRAAIGMSENSDAIIIVVSEETGQISVAENGVLVRDFTRFKLNEYLHEAILPKPVDMKKKLPVKKGFRFKGDGKK
ncbi:MAG: diadenylate cyclase CdaA [Oscillospiraceae bacterium]|nr:diadenylate cyclase CdaA [Oscillospiraceae bacterium]